MTRPDLTRKAVRASKGGRALGRKGVGWGDRGIRIFAVILVTTTAILLTTIRVIPASDAAVGDSGMIFDTPGPDQGRHFMVSTSTSTPPPETFKGVSGYSIIVRVQLSFSGWLMPDPRNSLLGPITFQDDFSGLPPGTRVRSCSPSLPLETGLMPEPRAFCKSATRGSSIRPTPGVFVELHGIKHIASIHTKRIVLFVPYSDSLHQKTW